MEIASSSLLGLLSFILGVTLIYFILQPREEETRNPRELEPFSPLGHYERCQLEYQAFSEGVRSRDHYTMITGSIIVSASAIILVESFTLPTFRVWIVMVALLLFALWLLCYYCTTRKNDNENYIRMRMLERSLGLQISSYLRSRTRGELWHFFRIHFWLLVFWVLSVFSFMLLLS